MKKPISLAASVLAAGTLVAAGAAFAEDPDAQQTGAGQTTTTTTTQGGTEKTTTTETQTATDKRGGSHAETEMGKTPKKEKGKKHHKASRAATSANFANTAAQDGMAEVELGRLATQKATDPAVKAFAQRMVDDHSRLNAQLQQVAQAQNMTLPTTLAPSDQAEVNRLSSLSGPAFDKAYMQRMVRDHQKDVSAFQNEANNGQNPQIKAMAASALPTLQSHLSQAQQILSQMQ